MSGHPLRVGIIVASTREGRFGPTVAAWFAAEARDRPDLDTHIIDLAIADPATKHLAVADLATRHLAVADLATKHLAVADLATRHLAVADPAAKHLAVADPTTTHPGRAGTGTRRSPEVVANHLADGGTVTEQLAAADAFVVVTPEYNHSYPAPLKAAIDGHFREWVAKPVGFVSYGGLSGGLRAVEHLRPVFAELHAVTVRDTVSFHGARACFGLDGQPFDAGGSSAAAKRLLDGLAWWGHTLREARAARPYLSA